MPKGADIKRAPIEKPALSSQRSSKRAASQEKKPPRHSLFYFNQCHRKECVPTTAYTSKFQVRSLEFYSGNAVKRYPIPPGLGWYQKRLSRIPGLLSQQGCAVHSYLHDIGGDYMRSLNFYPTKQKWGTPAQKITRDRERNYITVKG